MKPEMALVAFFGSARAGSATEPTIETRPTGPSTPMPGAGVGGLMRRALSVAAVVVLAACGGDGDSGQVGPDTNGRIRGTVTDASGGTVAIESERERGTTVIVRLPIAE